MDINRANNSDFTTSQVPASQTVRSLNRNPSQWRQYSVSPSALNELTQLATKQAAQVQGAEISLNQGDSHPTEARPVENFEYERIKYMAYLHLNRNVVDANRQAILSISEDLASINLRK